MSNNHLGSWCPQCGYDVPTNEDGFCRACGATAVGDGADTAIQKRNELARLKVFHMKGCDCAPDDACRLAVEREAAIDALKAWKEFWDAMPKGQLGSIVCDIGLLNDAFVKMRKVLGE